MPKDIKPQIAGIMIKIKISVPNGIKVQNKERKKKSLIQQTMQQIMQINRNRTQILMVTMQQMSQLEKRVVVIVEKTIIQKIIVSRN